MLKRYNSHTLTAFGMAFLLLVSLSTAKASEYTLDLPFDLSTGYYNPSYGDTFYNAPGRETLSNPVTLQAGDRLTINYDYLPGQSLEVQKTTGQYYQQLAFAMYGDGLWGVAGTYSLTLHGLQGSVTQNPLTGNLNGANFFFVDAGAGHLTDSAFSFTGFTIVADVTSIRNNYYQTGTSFTASAYEFQAYGDKVTPHYGAASVPDSGSTLLLLGVAVAPLAAWTLRRRRAAPLSA
jgi:hypothetical protein